MEILQKSLNSTPIKLSVLVTTLICVLLFACSKSQSGVEEANCIAPDNFSFDDLVGTWTLGVGKNTDTIIIESDGTYRQVVQIDYKNYYYESQSLPWRIEYSDQNIPYLHLTEMELCRYWDLFECGLKDEYEYSFYDRCQGEWMSLENEGLLMVLGNTPGFLYPQKGIRMVALTKSTHRSNVYNFQD